MDSIHSFIVQSRPLVLLTRYIILVAKNNIKVRMAFIYVPLDATRSPRGNCTVPGEAKTFNIQIRDIAPGQDQVLVTITTVSLKQIWIKNSCVCVRDICIKQQPCAPIPVGVDRLSPAGGTTRTGLWSRRSSLKPCDAAEAPGNPSELVHCRWPGTV